MDTEKRDTFNEVAEVYDRVRNHYPEELFEDLFRIVQLSPDARVLEIGPGTGFATLQIAKRGYSVVGVELGTEMAKVTRRKLAAFPNVDIEIAAFEEWTPPAEPFDLVMAAASFHFLDPDVRYSKTASVLRHGGYLAIVNYHHVAGGDQDFLDRVQSCYQKVMPRKRRLSGATDVQPEPDELQACVLFEQPLARDYITEETYDAEQYIDLLSTYGDHGTLQPADRHRLFDCIRALIDRHYGGKVVKRYLNELILLRRQ